MIRLGINTMVWSGACGESELSLFERIRKWGYDAVELPIFDFTAVNRDLVRRAAADSGLALTVTSALPSGLSLVSADEATRERTRRWIEAAVETTAALGSTILAGPLYLPVGEISGSRRTAAQWKWAVDEFRKLGEAIRGSGARVAVEPLNRFETYFLNIAADARRLCEEVSDPSIGVLFDTFHANIEEDDPLAALRSLGRHLLHVHLSENQRGVPGSGHVPFAAAARVLNEMEYSGFAVVESFAASIPEIARATAMWRDFAASPDEFARQALQNLRPLFPSV